MAESNKNSGKPAPGGKNPAPVSATPTGSDRTDTHAVEVGAGTAIPATHGRPPTQNPSGNAPETVGDAKRQTTVGAPVGTPTGAAVPNGPLGGETAPVVTPGDGLEPARAGGPNPSFKRGLEDPVPMVVLAVGDDGDDVTVKDVVGLIREIIADVGGGQFWEAFDDVGTLLKWSRLIFGTGQYMAVLSTPASRREAFGQWAEFDKACDEFARAKANGFVFAASANTIPPAASGAPLSMGGPIGVRLTPGDFAQIIGVVETIIDLIRRLRQTRGG